MIPNGVMIYDLRERKVSFANTEMSEIVGLQNLLNLGSFEKLRESLKGFLFYDKIPSNNSSDVDQQNLGS